MGPQRNHSSTASTTSVVSNPPVELVTVDPPLRAGTYSGSRDSTCRNLETVDVAGLQLVEVSANMVVSAVRCRRSR